MDKKSQHKPSFPWGLATLDLLVDPVLLRDAGHRHQRGEGHLRHGSAALSEQAEDDHAHRLQGGDRVQSHEAEVGPLRDVEDIAVQVRVLRARY